MPEEREAQVEREARAARSVGNLSHKGVDGFKRESLMSLDRAREKEV
jgi:hypothetical protein